MLNKFAGKTYQIEKAENVDAFLIAYGVKDAGLREAALKMTMRQTLSVDGDQYTVHMEIGPRKLDIPFRLGEEFEETTMGGEKAQTTFSLQGDDTLVQQQKLPGGRHVTTERKFSDSHVTVTQTIGDVTAKSTYKAI
ncbi:fatty acid-binding protein-like [Schistocerca piceifrons]|uniref:fatty acid-binding protein-like n=1 Tax=Schistocerca piceifrons TaxID=274613 RepID=UPI001F5FA061|nr:fatty acid-binding protein-like [Schistocerca piceifrons]